MSENQNQYTRMKAIHRKSSTLGTKCGGEGSAHSAQLKVSNADAELLIAS
jgi:hypothetical protein